MAGTKISDYGLGTTKWSEMLTTIEKQRKGFISLSLTNYDNNSLPEISEGSYVEIAGALYGFTSNESIGGSATSSQKNYIMIDPSTITAEWTTTAPTWSDAKQGWYGTGDDAEKRYVGGCYYDGSDYTKKFVYIARDVIVDLDDIPDGSTNKHLTTGTQIFQGRKNFDDGFVVENRTSDPGSPVTGQTWFRTNV